MGSSERAEGVWRAESFDAAVIGVGLPGMDGLGLMRRLRRSQTVRCRHAFVWPGVEYGT